MYESHVIFFHKLVLKLWTIGGNQNTLQIAPEFVQLDEWQAGATTFASEAYILVSRLSRWGSIASDHLSPNSIHPILSHLFLSLLQVAGSPSKAPSTIKSAARIWSFNLTVQRTMAAATHNSGNGMKFISRHGVSDALSTVTKIGSCTDFCQQVAYYHARIYPAWQHIESLYPAWICAWNLGCSNLFVRKMYVFAQHKCFSNLIEITLVMLSYSNKFPFSILNICY